MRRGVSNPSESELICYADHMIYINEYLCLFPVSNVSDKIDETELNEMSLNSMPNVWSK